MTQIIDRRLNGKNKSAVNRQRFLRRYKQQIKSAIDRAVAKRSIKDIDRGETVSIPVKDIFEPYFKHQKGGVYESIFPGNKSFVMGDHLPRPPSSPQGSKSQASDQGEGEDDFRFAISREELLDLYFDDLALPDLAKKQLSILPSYQYVRAGITTQGTPTNINVVRSMRQATGRRFAFGNVYKKAYQQLMETLETLEKQTPKDEKKIHRTQEEIEKISRKLQAIPFIDKIDLRYNYRVKRYIPSTQAVMFCLMDVSGSMDENKKEIAKRFFILLYLFLKRNYQHIDIVFIRHHTSAKEVDEETFFYSRETGGTVVSSALQLTSNLIEERYPKDIWNIYVAQASDGDNWNADSPYCKNILLEKIMPLVQYYAYTEIMPRHHQSLWEMYAEVKKTYDNFAMQTINQPEDIYPVLHKLFKKK